MIKVRRLMPASRNLHRRVHHREPLRHRRQRQIPHLQSHLIPETPIPLPPQLTKALVIGEPGTPKKPEHMGPTALRWWWVLLLFGLVASAAAAVSWKDAESLSGYAEAPQFRNGESCPPPMPPVNGRVNVCDPSLVHIAMTLDSHYLRGSMAAVYSLLKHASCPDSLFFHFIATPSPALPVLRRAVATSFPNLHFRIYEFRESLVTSLISASVRAALESPLNYARNHLGDLLPMCVTRVIYLDSDILAVDDIQRLWLTRLPNAAVVAAPEYCHANFSRYFTNSFWSDPNLGPQVFKHRRKSPCYFNTGVMVIDLRRFRAGNFKRRIERWMEIQKEKRIYELGSLPPFLLVFAGEVEAVDHRWNQHGLGGDNVEGSCRPLHAGPVSLMHWSGKGKPWDRLDNGRPCPLDRLWQPYDLYVGEEEGRLESVAKTRPSSIFSW